MATMKPDELTLNGVLDAAAEDHPDSEALVSEHRRLTYAEFRDAVTRFARGLLGMGVGMGDHVGVLVSNRPEWFVATYAAERIGATVVALNTWYESDELAYALQQTDVSMLITMDSFLGHEYLETLSELGVGPAGDEVTRIDSAEFPFLDRVVVVGDSPSWTVSWDDVVEQGESVSSQRVAAARETVTPDDDAYVLFSSGTTGQPKPIVLQHDALVTNAWGIGARLDANSTDRFWLALPLFFSFAACNESITALTRGATLVLQERFDSRETIELIDSEECTVLYGMGNMYRQLESTQDDLAPRLESVRVALVIGPPSLRERYQDRHEIETVVNGYGLTEVCAMCTITERTAARDTRTTTVGYPLPNVDVRIKEPETGEDVAPGTLGEICLRGRTLFRTYYGLPSRTREAFDGEGFFHTGDVGRLDPNGRLIFEGRIKDLIKTGGINVSPKQVENVLEQHPDIREAVVLGLPDPEKDEIVAAVVRPAVGVSLDAENVIAFCEGRIASYKIPERVVVRATDFPRTDTGKVRMDELREESFHQ